MLFDETLEASVLVRQRRPQEQVQLSKEGHGVQAVEGEAAGERQQRVGGRDRPGRRVCHDVAIHWTAEGRWKNIIKLFKVQLNKHTSALTGDQINQDVFTKNLHFRQTEGFVLMQETESN